MKAVIDDKIPFIRGILEPYAEVVYLPGAQIRRDHLLDADCLITRTRTRCNRELLEGTKVRFIASATIGFDHIDTLWCKQAGIRWTNSPGCNSGSVAQYITTALLEMSARLDFNLHDKTLGIIGVGHVGSKVQRIAKLLGMHVLLNDPPRSRAEGPDLFTDLKTLLSNSDIITLHVPLNREGPDKTLHLVDREFLEAMQPGAILINTSRGEVVDESALIQWAKNDRKQNPSSLVTHHSSLVTRHSSLVLDVWENEPHINRDLLYLADIATPHIAGYSLDGKMNATRMVVQAVAAGFGLKVDPDDGLAGFRACGLSDHSSRITYHDSCYTLHDYIRATYDILADDRRLRESPDTFEEQRNNYPERREFSAYTIDPFPDGDLRQLLKAMGFNTL
jgi:erythronate-4-phosphate dehydrogenase